MGKRSISFGVVGLLALACTSDFDSFEFGGKGGGSGTGGSAGSGTGGSTGGTGGGGTGGATGGAGGATGGTGGIGGATGGTGGATGGAGGATGGTGGATGGAGGATGGTGGATGGTGGATGGTGGATGGTGGATGGTGGATGGTGGATGGTGGATGGTGGATGAGVVTCESENSCDLSSDYCCVSNNNFNCQPTGQSCQPGTDVFCDGPEDCSSGQVCCAQVNGSFTFVLSLECRAANDCQQVQNRFITCGSSPSVCPSGTTCGPGTLLQKYQFCIP